MTEGTALREQLEPARSPASAQHAPDTSPAGPAIPAAPPAMVWGSAAQTREAKLRRRYPTIEDLRKRAKRRVPSFAYDYVDGAAGAHEPGAARNLAALDAVEIVPRFGVENGPRPIEVELFGRHYAAPVGIAPMGLPGMEPKAW